MIKSSRMRLAGNVAGMGGKKNACRIMVGKPDGKSPLEGPGRKWQDNGKMGLRETEWDDMDLIYMAQDRDQ
jgi:hypothetical protein